ncbi:DNA binding protein vP5 [Microviridae sp.]|nr:DNA binding protein vP5 [Microviridae sp.]
MLKIFTIYDLTAQRAGPLFTMESMTEAERYFHDGLKNAQEGSLWKSHPQDFVLYYLGEYDPKKLSISDICSTQVTVGKPLPSTAVSA